MNIQKILDDHKLWVAGKGGKRADLSGFDLSEVNFHGANLSGANLNITDLKKTNLRGANLSGACLYKVNLYDAEGILQWQSPQGKKRICYSVKHDDCVMHKLGCFWGTTEEAVTAIRKKYGERSLYEQALVLMAKCLEEE